MKRFFLSHAPRFGSYKSPDKNKIEKSPYFFWWLAASYFLNQKGCHIGGRHSWTEDFGSIEVGMDRYKSFTNWWNEELHTGEKRGEFLFAEPINGRKTHLVSSLEEAQAALSDGSSVLVSINLQGQKKFIERNLDEILSKVTNFERGRNVRNPKNSNARYSLSKPVQIDVLKRIFRVYELRVQGKKISNYEIYKIMGFNLPPIEDEGINFYRQRISTLVSRDYVAAKRIVESVGKGVFP